MNSNESNENVQSKKRTRHEIDDSDEHGGDETELTIQAILDQTFASSDSSDDSFKLATGDSSSDSDSGSEREGEEKRINGNKDATPNHVYQNNVR